METIKTSQEIFDETLGEINKFKKAFSELNSVAIEYTRVADIYINLKYEDQNIIRGKIKDIVNRAVSDDIF